MNGLPLSTRSMEKGRARSSTVTMPTGMSTAATMLREAPSGSP